jgi:hypothetical protein
MLRGLVQENQERLRGLADSDGLVHRGDGTGAKIPMLVKELPMGSRVPGAGQVAVIVRQLPRTAQLKTALEAESG